MKLKHGDLFKNEKSNGCWIAVNAPDGMFYYCLVDNTDSPHFGPHRNALKDGEISGVELICNLGELVSKIYKENK